MANLRCLLSVNAIPPFWSMMLLNDRRPRSCRSTQVLVDFFLKVNDVAFADISLYSAVGRALSQDVLIMGRVKYNLYFACLIFGTEHKGKLIAGQRRHIQIEQDKVGPEFAHDLHDAETVLMGENLKSIIPKQLPCYDQMVFVIVYY